MNPVSFWTQNPYSLQNIEKYEYLSSAQLEAQITDSFAAWQLWQKTENSHREQVLLRLAKTLRENSSALASCMSSEMGKPLFEALAEVEKSASAIEYVAANFANWLKTDTVNEAEGKYILKTSLGPILMVMPWNFPLWQVIRIAAPSLAAGNALLLKGSDQVAGTSKMLVDLFAEVLPKALFQNFCVSHEQVQLIIADPRVRGVTFTGSTRGGRQIATAAGAALKKVVLELGGSDPYLLLEDCDLKKSAKLCATGRLINTGQSCVAAKRFFVPRQRLDLFCHEFSQHVESVVAGDPLQVETRFGVLASLRFKTQLETQVNELIRQGAKLRWQSALQGPGAFYPPQILEAPLSLSAAHHEELFGPVALVFAYDELSEAIKAANSSPYGLGAAVFSKDEAVAKKVALQLDAGQVAINDFIKSDARLPFGGVKESGFGRELSPYGFQEFLNIRALSVARS